MAPRAWLAAIVAAVTLASPALADSPTHVAEPAGLWTGVMVSETPRTLAGAEVIDVPALERLLAQKPLLIDVGPADRKPDNLSADVVWKPIHRSIPGTVWFPGAGPGDLPAAKAEALLRRVDELTNGNRSMPVVTFCQPRCWGSWNVGKRLVQAGYTSVHWLPAGVSGWQEANETVVVDPQPGWGPKPAASQGGS
ncbi:MAG TPA: rhodanese-like domain-containing protein [Geminicoccus sp.]|jgi:PQQ-dependent catabolism-associated CXXCW motif protein|uniref:rhodanese-like domain-containing protein n=1 Tax=Geminicoccus sp. TaxID=2024832 RepID=UPI002E2EEE7F|nr:rhodanese-like domain-containing protein [Geminicoccus sp.]HEX2528788.1 rhodanese-like domain-containing protein [Geminicoccus sp.]